MNDGERIVFILGITPRSGTNFLHRLLCQHPDFGGVTHTPIREDYLLHHSHHLSDFVRSVGWQWSHWGDESDLKMSLAEALGLGISHFVTSLSEDERVVLKTPSVRGLEQFSDLFPNAYLLIIIRDGRSVVASGMSGFGWDFEAATRRWAHAARTISRFRESTSLRSDRFRIVRYEELNAHPTQEFESILKFLNADVNGLDVEKAANLPVYGSSFTGKSEGEVSWKPVEKKDHFSSNKRWDGWDRARHERFNWLAGAELRALGYSPKEFSRSRLIRTITNTAHDLAYATKRWPNLLFHTARSGRNAARRHIDLNRYSRLG